MSSEHEATTWHEPRYCEATTLTGATPGDDDWYEMDLVPWDVDQLFDVFPSANYISVHHELTTDHYRVER